MPSVREIARVAGVSVATVSRSLNNLPDVNPDTRRRVLEAANQFGYTPRIGRRQTSVIGLVYTAAPAHTYYGDFDSALFSGILQGVNEQKFDVKVINLERDKTSKENYTQFFMRKGISGAIMRNIEASRTVCKAIAAEGFPHVVAADRFEDPEVSYICCDSRADTKRAVQHLIDLGHRRIGLAVHSVRDTDHHDRSVGYHAALDEAGIAYDPSIHLEIFANLDGGGTAISRLMSLPNPVTAIVFTDPMATLGGIRRCRELQIRIPGDLSIIGFDDSDVRHHTFPELTAVCQGARALGHEAALQLTRMIASKSRVPIRTVLSTTFEINHTTGRCPEKPVRILPDGSRSAPMMPMVAPVVVVPSGKVHANGNAKAHANGNGHQNGVVKTSVPNVKTVKKTLANGRARTVR